MLASIFLLYLTIYVYSSQVSAKLARRSPPYNYAFRFPLPIPPIKSPSTSYIEPGTNKTLIDFYELTVQPISKRLFPDLQDAALIGYDGMVPGPTFRVQRGRETVVRMVNNGSRTAVQHLHGSNSRSPWDGWTMDSVAPGQYKDYYYPNSQNARTLWYHDHAMSLTTLNIYAGLSGFYLLQDDALEEKLDLPRGKYDIPLLLTSHFFTSTGDISNESAERTSTYGDTFSVNGQIQPYLAVEPRKYRFRLLNSAASRTFNLSLSGEPFDVVGSDSGFMAKPVETTSLIIGMSERWEIVIDFTNFASRNLTLGHTTVFDDEDYEGLDQVMQFNVGETVTSQVGNGPLPETLVNIPSADPDVSIDQEFSFSRNIGRPWTINGVAYSDSGTHILRNVALNTTETWSLRGNAGWSHPVHLHEVDFRIISRSIGNPNQRPGRQTVTPYEAEALKDVVVLGDNEAVTIQAHYAPFPGLYLFHCHNSVHEDFAMMAVFNISALAGMGYDNVTLGLEDPLDPRFSPKIYQKTDLEQVKGELLPAFRALKAYGL